MLVQVEMLAGGKRKDGVVRMMTRELARVRKDVMRLSRLDAQGHPLDEMNEVG
jgi:hypothetical protein